MHISISKDVEKLLIDNKLNFTSKDLDRPWGGFLVIDEDQSQKFANH